MTSSTENLEETIGQAANRMTEESVVQDFLSEEDSDYGDPKPPSPQATPEQRNEYILDCEKYASETLDTFIKYTTFSGRVLWEEYTRTFRPETIYAISSNLVIRWTNYLRDGGVRLEYRRGFSRRKALAATLSAENFPDGSQEPLVEDQQEEQQEEEIVDLSAQELHTTPVQEDNNKQPQPPPTKPTPFSFPLEQKKEPVKTRLDVPTQHFLQQNDRDDVVYNRLHDKTERSYSKSRIDSINKAFLSRDKYSGAFTENFDGHVEEYETLCRVFELTNDEMARAFPIMLKGAAFTHYSHHYARKKLNYRELVEEFRIWYTSEEQKYRLLQVWQRPSLEKAMANDPDKSQMEVFRHVSDELIKTQLQLHEDYRKDRFLRDQLLIAADIPRLRRSLIERIPSTAQEAMQRIATLLSSEPKSAGAFFTNDADAALYGFGKRFGGQARGKYKKFGKKDSLKRKLALVRGCWVCGKNHPAKGNHSPQEIINAVNRIKSSKPARAFTAEEVEMLQESYTAMIAEESEEEVEGDVDDASGGEGDDEVNYSNELSNIERQTQQKLSNISYLHSRGHYDIDEIPTGMAFAIYSNGLIFDGIILDTGANRISVMCLSQYEAYCREFGCPVDINYSENKGLNGIGGKSVAIGSAKIPIPFIELGIVIDVRFRIMRDRCPSLLSLKDMISNGLDLSIQEKTISIGDEKQSLLFENDFLKHKWSPKDMDTALYTEDELRKLHKHFGHPSVHALHKLLRTANPDECGEDVRKALESISQGCKSCQRNAPATRRFKISIGTGALRFNNIVAVDVMYIDGRPVLHVVDEATHYASACFLKKMTAEETWKSFLRCWSRVYVGPPDKLRVDQGSNFVAKSFLDSAQADGIEVIPVAVESPSSMSHVERYHAPLRLAYTRIRDDLPRSETDAECLQLAVKCINDTVGPEGLCPTMLVFGTIPRPPRRTPAPTQLQRASVIEKCMSEVRKEFCKRKLAFALRHPRNAAAQDQERRLQKLPSGSPVLVYRTKSRKWEGPFRLVSTDDGTAVVQLKNGRKIFRTSAVKPVNGPLDTSAHDEFAVGTNSYTPIDPLDDFALLATEKSCEFDSNNSQDTHSTVLNGDSSGTKSSRQCSSSSTMSPNNANAHETIDKEEMDHIEATIHVLHAMESDEEGQHEFTQSRLKELTSLLSRGVFKIVKKDTVPVSERIYGTKWVDTMKTVDGNTFPKSRLVAQNYNDEGAAEINTKSPTISRTGQRIVLATAALSPKHELYTRDITQAYVQSESELERPVYLYPPAEMHLSSDYVLLAIKPIYGVPESGVHWFNTYQDHHVNRLNMCATKFDPCLLYLREQGKLKAVTALQVDDNLGHGDQAFLEAEQEQSRMFESKPRKLVIEGECIEFNGVKICVEKGRIYCMDQREKICDVKEPTDEEALISARAKLQYIASCTRPDISAAVQILASDVNNPTAATYLSMKNIIKWCHDTSEVKLRFIPLQRHSLRLLLFTDASFACTPNLKSRMGFVLVLGDTEGRANILAWGSQVCSRVTRSVMAAELLALVYGFDCAHVVQNSLREILGFDVPIYAHVDSRTVFNTVAKHNSTLEKRLQIDVHSIRQSYRRGEIYSLSWISGKTNPADGLTKGPISASHPLWRLMVTNQYKTEPSGWVRQVPIRPRHAPERDTAPLSDDYEIVISRENL